MNEVLKILHKVIFLIIDILVLAYQIIKQVILPNRRRKGNVLSSLLSFFVGLIENILTFEKSIFSRSLVCKFKYIKQALVLAASFLFLISSIEWTVSQSAVSTVNETQAAVANEPASSAVKVLSERPIYIKNPVRNFVAAAYLSYTTPYKPAEVPLAIKNYFLYCTLRI
jgi:hypothetical protein